MNICPYLTFWPPMSLKDATFKLTIVNAFIYTLYNIYIECMFLICLYRILQTYRYMIYIMWWSIDRIRYFMKIVPKFDYVCIIVTWVDDDWYGSNDLLIFYNLSFYETSRALFLTRVPQTWCMLWCICIYVLMI